MTSTERGEGREERSVCYFLIEYVVQHQMLILKCISYIEL